MGCELGVYHHKYVCRIHFELPTVPPVHMTIFKNLVITNLIVVVGRWCHEDGVFLISCVRLDVAMLMLSIHLKEQLEC